MLRLLHSVRNDEKHFSEWIHTLNLVKKNVPVILTIMFLGRCFHSSATNFLFKAKHDTSYYVSHKNMLAIKILVVSKTPSFGVFDDVNKSKLLYYPNEMLNLGFGFNYNRFGLDLAFNVPVLIMIMINLGKQKNLIFRHISIHGK